jgi:hypothetical protein
MDDAAHEATRKRAEQLRTRVRTKRQAEWVQRVAQQRAETIRARSGGDFNQQLEKYLGSLKAADTHDLDAYRVQRKALETDPWEFYHALWAHHPHLHTRRQRVSMAIYAHAMSNPGSQQTVYMGRDRFRAYLRFLQPLSMHNYTPLTWHANTTVSWPNGSTATFCRYSREDHGYRY